MPQQTKSEQITTETEQMPADGSAAKKLQSKEVKELVRQYLLPAGLFILSLLLILNVILPLLQDVFAGLENINKRQEDYTALQEQKRKREALTAETNQQEASLTKINKLIPQAQTVVAEFREKVGERARTAQVNINESTLGEVVVFSTNAGTASLAQENGLELVEIPAEFSLTGKLVNIRKFLSGLYGGEDFLIIKEMELNKQANDSSDALATKFNTSNSDTWVLKLILTKYQFKLAPDADETKVKQFYFSIPDTQRADRTVLDFIDKVYD